MSSAIASSSGSRQRQPGVFDVRDYGGVANTNTEPAMSANVRAIQAALDAAYAAGSGRAHLPPGTWYTNRPVFVPGRGISLVGAGAGTTLQCGGSYGRQYVHDLV